MLKSPLQTVISICGCSNIYNNQLKELRTSREVDGTDKQLLYFELMK